MESIFLIDKIWLYAAVGGFAPTIFWLMFWLRQDVREPEPRGLIATTFVYGAASAFFALFFQVLASQSGMESIFGSTIMTYIFSFIEEFVKLFAVFLAALGTVWNNEREDPMIYMITGALGFSAIENMYYLIDYINDGSYFSAIINSSYRIIGASLLHTITSAIVGLFISFVFFKSKKTRVASAIAGLVAATGVHSLFNIYVTDYSTAVFFSAWVLVIVLLILFEIVDRTEKYRRINIDYSDSFRKKFY